VQCCCRSCWINNRKQLLSMSVLWWSIC
jgi:hypothetical protein